VGTYEDLIPTADLVCNPPDKQHTAVVTAIMPLMKKGLHYLIHMVIVEEGMQIRKDITVIMCAPNVLDPKYVRSIKRF
jgi:ketol-acid reductoisomerase